ncbi:hypothetical protein TREMEDRAFT_27125 [Tremella mesenterica DSM 1558]|uniref:uncharacterized protein n=1 Tax=Tremella mesenterica (strain ATCC 24925 / CBS 8224 / DSM 1558 / NBRC 9311 / NRRL Y-6157 / RJB 2259-6 / UBC 559-6) TaxID=578456 RepID=UPI0003F49119|nr:uncharacterized protein TREMEDRAFT_27125 [Tremella mesenterica DSM 1558]EIW71103.1 hypothetical protein TREMEDRAFT_27125 [Tremella mesenterica DSM 1558]
MLPLLLLSTLSVALVGASPISTRANDTVPRIPQVTIIPSTSNGEGITLTGVAYPQFKQDVYLGIPFAEPPVGDLRFRPPQSKVYNSSSFNATVQSPACLQNPNTSLSGDSGISEDCLYLNVYTPEGWGPQSPPIPVMVWIYGGSYQAGATSSYNATALMARGMATNRPFIFVAVAYRLNILGFGYGAEIATNNAANLGLRDITLGLQWVQDNIWAFGGDPTQVTAFGQSAGAISISLLYLNQNTTLFRSAIMESGAQSVAPLGPTATTWQVGYDLLTEFSGCAAVAAAAVAGNSTSNSTTVVGSAAYNQSTFELGPSIDGDLIPDSPHTMLQEGKFAQIPFISGNCLDEGTSFVPTSVTNETQVGLYIEAAEPVHPNVSIIGDLFQLYPNNATLGSPYGTGNETFGFAPEFKQIAAIVGDAQFQANRRWFLEQARAHGQSDTWSYLWTEPPAGLAAYRGVAHSSEVYYVFGFTTPETGYNASQVALASRVEDYWINFAYYTDPNGPSGTTSNLTYWPAYGSNSTMLQFAAGNDTLIPDTYRKTQMDFFNGNPTAFNYRRSLYG